MAKQTVNIGVSANDNTGDPLRTAFDKLNDNFDEVYAAGPVGTNIQISDNTIASTNTNGNIDLDPAGTGKVLVNGPMDANGVITLNSTVTGNVVPTAANTYNLGSSSAPYKELYVSGSSLHIGNLVLKEVDTMLEVFQADGVTNAILSGNSTTAGSVLNSGNTVVALTQNGPVTFYANNYQDPSATVTVINTSNITTPNLVTGNVTASGNVEGDFITASTAVISTGGVQGATVTATGNIDAGNIATSGVLTAVGNITGGNVNTGDLVATNVTGTLQTADQPTVTGLGTLTDLQVAGDLSITDPTAIIDSYAITANGTVTATSFQSTTGNASLSDSGVNFADGTTQTSAYKTHFKFLTSNQSAISATLTDAFGEGLDAEAGKYYEFMAHIIMTNSSTGTIDFNIGDSNGGVENAYVMITGAEQSGAITETRQIVGLGTVTTTFSTAATFHLQVVGTFRVTTNTKVSFNISTSAGTLTPIAGSNFRFNEHPTSSIGSIS